MGMPRRMVFSAHQGPLISVTASACKAVKGMSVCKHLLDQLLQKHSDVGYNKGHTDFEETGLKWR